jgi:hypothetical protein
LINDIKTYKPSLKYILLGVSVSKEAVKEYVCLKQGDNASANRRIANYY